MNAPETRTLERQRADRRRSEIFGHEAAPGCVSIEDAMRDHLDNPFAPPLTTAHLENARRVVEVMRSLSRPPGVIEQIRAAKSADDVHALLGEHLTDGTAKIRRRWAVAGVDRLGELRAGALR